MFNLLPQSGYDQPNSLKGLLVWVDASEVGTLSRFNSSGISIYDKAPGGAQYGSALRKNQPRILQGKLNNKTVLRFNYPHQFFIGDLVHDCSNVTIFIVANGAVTIDNNVCDIHNNTIRIPTAKSLGVKYIELAELLIYDTNSLTKENSEFVIDYLKNKWNV